MAFSIIIIIKEWQLILLWPLAIDGKQLELASIEIIYSKCVDLRRRKAQMQMMSQKRK